MKTEKYCKRCDTTKPVADFTPSAARSDGLQSYCRECMKLYRTEHYRANKQQYYDRNKASNDRARAHVLNIKNTTPCADCGVLYKNEPWLTEFDHLPGTKKVRNISQWVANFGLVQGLIDEISKCELVCLICHRRRTAERGKWRVDKSDQAVL